MLILKIRNHEGTRDHVENTKIHLGYCNRAFIFCNACKFSFPKRRIG